MPGADFNSQFVCVSSGVSRGEIPVVLAISKGCEARLIELFSDIRFLGCEGVSGRCPRRCV